LWTFRSKKPLGYIINAVSVLSLKTLAEPRRNQAGFQVRTGIAANNHPRPPDPDPPSPRLAQTVRSFFF
jgi:hypothetical protein